mmetsp:Transcript_4542/g.14550  ORF Transcript_4542/g.14550 Transcript_4542/m.14550 type:complete len:277 (+) Transcript_4542:204-1034(+)
MRQHPCNGHGSIRRALSRSRRLATAAPRPITTRVEQASNQSACGRGSAAPASRQARGAPPSCLHQRPHPASTPPPAPPPSLLRPEPAPARIPSCAGAAAAAAAVQPTSASAALAEHARGSQMAARVSQGGGGGSLAAAPGKTPMGSWGAAAGGADAAPAGATAAPGPSLCRQSVCSTRPCAMHTSVETALLRATAAAMARSRISGPTLPAGVGPRQSLLLHNFFRTPLPPNLGLSRHSRHWPQSGAKHAGHAPHLFPSHRPLPIPKRPPAASQAPP